MCTGVCVCVDVGVLLVLLEYVVPCVDDLFMNANVHVWVLCVYTLCDCSVFVGPACVGLHVSACILCMCIGVHVVISIDVLFVYSSAHVLMCLCVGHRCVFCGCWLHVSMYTLSCVLMFCLCILVHMYCCVCVCKHI